jgi:hypothetical protein
MRVRQPLAHEKGDGHGSITRNPVRARPSQVGPNARQAELELFDFVWRVRVVPGLLAPNDRWSKVPGNSNLRVDQGKARDAAKCLKSGSEQYRQSGCKAGERHGV